MGDYKNPEEIILENIVYDWRKIAITSGVEELLKLDTGDIPCHTLMSEHCGYWRVGCNRFVCFSL